VAHPRLKPRARGAIATLLAAVAAGACGGRPPPPAAVPPPPVPVVSNPELPDRGWGAVVSQRFFVALPLPDAAAWSVDDRSGRWLSAAHLPTRSMIWVRSWREGSVVSHAKCEIAARTLRPDLFGPDESALVDRKSLGAPSGFDTELGFSVRRAGGALGGVVVAVGAKVRQCLVMAYATRAEGPGAEVALARRLAFVATRIFARAEGRSIDDRVAPTGAH
jgi:hypothetical protein